MMLRSATTPRLARAARPRATLVALSVVAVLGGCSRKPVQRIEIDCSVEDPYEFLPIQPFESEEVTWYGFGDNTPGAFRNHDATAFPGERTGLNVAQDIENGGRCGSTKSGRFVAEGHQDWGAGFGTWKLTSGAGYNTLKPVDGTDWEGISFWARSPGPSDKSLTFAFEDLRTFNWVGELRRDRDGNIVKTETHRNPELMADVTVDVIQMPADEADALLAQDCVPITELAPLIALEADDIPDVVTVVDRAGERRELSTADLCACHPDPEDTTEIVVRDSDGNLIGTEGEVDPLQCGNPFKRTLETTREWQFYKWPFESLWQDAKANRKDGMVISNIYAMGLTLAKGLKIDVWIDDIRLYRKKPAAPDAAVDDGSNEPDTMLEPDTASEPDTTSEPDMVDADAGTGG